MSKLADKAKGSKLRQSLSSDFSIEKTQPKEQIIRKIKHKEYPRSYRFDPEIINTLKGTLTKVNEASHKKISEARLVKALIFLSKEIDEEKLLKALKEVW